MRLIFIRHGEPDYNSDVLTQKGRLDAELLAKRVKKWNVDRVYVSPMGRAQETAAPSLLALNMEAETLDWLREFSHQVVNPTHGNKSVCWDYAPSVWADNPVMYTRNEWLDIEPCVSVPALKEQYLAATKGIDEIIAGYGYERHGNYYINSKNPKNRDIVSTVINKNTHYANTLPDEDAGETVVFFCHFGITCLLLSHLLNLPFNALTHGTLIPCTGVTIVTTEERWKNEAYFRMQTLGDVSHLLSEGVSVSSAGSFAPLFQG